VNIAEYVRVAFERLNPVRTGKIQDLQYTLSEHLVKRQKAASPIETFIALSLSQRPKESALRLGTRQEKTGRARPCSC
jgi:hypothetical protein